jgi:hypothetical protein
LQLTDLFEQRLGREHHSVADEAGHLVMQDARWNEPQDCLAPIDDERMARVVSALKTNDAGDTIGEQINDLALTFISPLGTDDDHILAHNITPFIESRLRHRGCLEGKSGQIEKRISGTHRVQQDQPRDHAHQTPDTQLLIAQACHRHQKSLHGLRAHERQNAFQHQIQRERCEQIGPIHERRA